MSHENAACEFDPDALQVTLRKQVPGRLEALSPAVEEMMAQARQMECSRGKEFEIETALREALANAIRHGCGNDPDKSVEVCVACDPARGMLIVVQQAIRRGLADPSAVLEEVRFRNRVLSLVHGDEALVATVSRSPAGGIQRRAAAALRDFESRNAGALRRWSGDPADLAGVQRVIARL